MYWDFTWIDTDWSLSAVLKCECLYLYETPSDTIISFTMASHREGTVHQSNFVLLYLLLFNVTFQGYFFLKCI